MAATTHSTSDVLAQFTAHEDAPVANALRHQAIARVRALGWPTTHNEAWKYTQLGSWLAALHREPTVGDTEAAQALLPATSAIRVVFVNGRFNAALSEGTATGAHIVSLDQAWDSQRAVVEAHLGSTGAHHDAALAAVNTALWQSGVLVHVATKQAVSTPIDIVHIVVGTEGVCVQPRVLIVAEPSSDVTVVETFVSAEGASHITNAVTEIVALDNAHVQHYVQQDEGRHAAHLGTLAARIGRDSQVHAAVLHTGAALARREVRTWLTAPGGSCNLAGLTLCRGNQHTDTQVSVEHQSPHCESSQTFTSIVDERAASVFAGKVLVAPHAIKTDAQQLNKNLLLSPQATAHTRPQLEILADDVKCAHGATVGQLDHDALFYLRSRGLDVAQARQLLTYAFAANVLNPIRQGDVRSRFDVRARQWLGLGAVGDAL